MHWQRPKVSVTFATTLSFRSFLCFSCVSCGQFNFPPAHEKSHRVRLGGFHLFSVGPQQLLCSDRLDHLVQTAFGARSGVIVQQILRSGLVDSLLCDPHFGHRQFAVASLDGITDAAKLTTQLATLGAVADPQFFVLTKSFFRARSIRHVWQAARAASKDRYWWFERRSLTPRSMPIHRPAVQSRWKKRKMNLEWQTEPSI